MTSVAFLLRSITCASFLSRHFLSDQIGQKNGGTKNVATGAGANGVDLRLYAGLFCLTRGEAKAEPSNQPRVHLTIFGSQMLVFDHQSKSNERSFQ